MSTTLEPEFYTIRRLTKRWALSDEVILTFIHSGELRAINLVSAGRTQRPRYKIRQEDVEAFEASRATKPAAKTPLKRRAAKKAAGDFF